MVKCMASLALTLASLVPASAPAQTAKKPLAEGGSVIVRVLPHKDVRTDGNYVVEGEESKDAQARYDELKSALDERFAHMFELKAKLEAQQNRLSSAWDEYYTLHECYNRELKKIIAAWVTESNYTNEK